MVLDFAANSKRVHGSSKDACMVGTNKVEKTFNFKLMLKSSQIQTQHTYDPIAIFTEQTYCGDKGSNIHYIIIMNKFPKL